MDEPTRRAIANLIRTKITEKLANYQAETNYTPFFSANFDHETIIKASLMQSLYTSFGMSIYEQIAVLLARAQGWEATRQYRLQGEIDPATESLIDRLCRSPSPNKQQELAAIRASIQAGRLLDDQDSVVDVFIRKADGTEFYVDITTVKPNLKEVRVMRRKMLRWAALRMSINPQVQLDTRIGIPYNPYHPEPYARWTISECDPNGDLLVQEALWGAFAGYDVFPELLAIFQEIGTELQNSVRAFVTP